MRLFSSVRTFARERALIMMLPAAAILAACGDSTEPTNNSTGPSLSITPCSVTGTLQIGSAQSARVDCSNGGTGVTLAGGSASYLIVPQFPVGQVTDVGPIPPLSFVSYELRAGAGVSASLAPSASLVSPLAASGALAGIRKPSVKQRNFDAALRARARAQIQSRRFGAAHSAAQMSLVPMMSVAPPPVGSIRTFRVIADSTGATTVGVAARLAYAGTNVLVYIDTLAPANGFTPAQLNAFGLLFDQTLYPIDTVAFGPPSDIDQNGRVIMLMTPRVNALTPSSQCQTEGYVAGFFEEEDLGGGIGDPNSNQGEIFYSLVPDPSGQSSCAHTVTDVGNAVPATFLHELQHLISFSQHFVIHGGNREEGWLDEGLSIVAEELGSLYYEQRCPGTSCRTDPSQIFPDSSQGFISGFLFDSYFYALAPDTASLTLHDDSQDGFSWRGGDWLLMRWIGDQFGQGVYRRLDENTVTGIANIQSSTGQAFPSLFSNFGLSIYTDSLPEMPRTTAPPTNRFVTRNLRQLWARLFATSAGDPEIPLVFPLPVRTVTSDSTTTFRMYPGTSAYFRLNTAASASTVTIQFAAPGGGALSSVYKPQLAIFRLPPGA